MRTRAQGRVTKRPAVPRHRVVPSDHFPAAWELREADRDFRVHRGLDGPLAAPESPDPSLLREETA